MRRIGTPGPEAGATGAPNYTRDAGSLRRPPGSTAISRRTATRPSDEPQPIGEPGAARFSHPRQRRSGRVNDENCFGPSDMVDGVRRHGVGTIWIGHTRSQHRAMRAIVGRSRRLDKSRRRGEKAGAPARRDGSGGETGQSRDITGVERRRRGRLHSRGHGRHYRWLRHRRLFLPLRVLEGRGYRHGRRGCWRPASIPRADEMNPGVPIAGRRFG